MTGKCLMMRDAARVDDKGEGNTTAILAIRDEELSRKKLISNQRGQAPLGDARSLKKQTNISKKTPHLDKDFSKDDG